MLRISLLFITILMVKGAVAQTNFRSKNWISSSDTIWLDTLSIVPGTVEVIRNGKAIDPSLIREEPFYGYILLSLPPGDSIQINYRVFPEQLTRIHYHKSLPENSPDIKNRPNSFSFQPGKKNSDFFDSDGLSKSGSISRGVNFGNNQDLSVNSNLNLQLSGKISDRVSILASITDDNIPIQPDGNTQQLQDFDQVFIKVYDQKSALIAGDFWMKKPKGYFMVYQKRGQGASFSTKQDFKKFSYETRTSAAISKGKFARNVIQGVEGNQGPYRLKGSENETFIIVLAGTEVVYIDGQQLKRGQENDYVIDYNTSEISFTPNRLITKDRRIIVEFQYSDKNYARSILESNNVFSKEKTLIYVNAYSEQDSKNQPLQQNLSDSAKLLLNSVGDSTQLAVFPSADSVGYSDNLVLYKKTDSLGYNPVYVYSTNPDSALYRLHFAFVGSGKGDYVQSEFTALGRTFKWVAPDTVGGIIYQRGDHNPVQVLISPKKRQMVSAGLEQQIGKKGRFSVEGVYTNYNRNTFSDLNKSDDQGYGFKIGYEQEIRIGKKENDIRIVPKVSLENISKNFSQIERFRAVEFERNWNILNRTLTGDQYISDVKFDVLKGKTGRLGYGFNTFYSGSSFQGQMQNGILNYQEKGWDLRFTRSSLQTNGAVKTQFNRHKSNLSKNLKGITIGFRDEQESNKFFIRTSDSLAKNSYSFYDYEIYLQSADSSNNRFGASYRERRDRISDTLSLSKATRARQYAIKTDLLKNPKNQLRINAGYRELEIIDTTLTSQKPDQTILTRIEYDFKMAKNAVSLSTFYEIGTGQELKKEFIYLEVPAGQGIYTWIDYNENGVKELNEFEIAAFPDQATYIRSFTPTNEYVKTYTNQFSQTLNLNPANIWKNKKGIRKKLSVLSNQTAYRVDRKTNSESEGNRFNPFLREVSDSSLLSLNASFRNTFFINRTGSVFGIDHTYQDVRGKSLLTNGFDSRFNRFHLIKIRWNITPEYNLVVEGEQGTKGNNSDFLSGRNYSISYLKANPKFSYQPNTKFRSTIAYKYSDKQNKEEYGNEHAVINDIGLEIRYNVVNKGSLLATFNYVGIIYNGNSSSSLGFEMLDALKPGTNFTWTASWQQNLSKHMQLNLTYNARKTESNKSIHTGGVQIRAYF